MSLGLLATHAGSQKHGKLVRTTIRPCEHPTKQGGKAAVKSFMFIASYCSPSLVVVWSWVEVSHFGDISTCSTTAKHTKSWPSACPVACKMAVQATVLQLQLDGI